MAFDYTNLYPDTSSNGGYTKSWNYTTVVDSISTCSASGYFNKVATRLGIGDHIVIARVDAFDTKNRTTLVEFADLFVTGISGGVVTTTNYSTIANAYTDSVAALKANLASPTFTGTVALPAVNGTGAATFTGTFSASNATVSFGLGGTGTATTVNLNGSSASQGLVVQYLKNSVLKWQNGLLVGISDDFAWFRNGASVYAIQISSTDDAVSFGSTTASTSTTTGGIKAAGGLGVGGDAFFGGKIVSVSATAGIGYATGAGGAVTQLTSRTTGVTLNKTCGAITLFAAAPTVGTWVSFTVTNSAIAATDVPHVSFKSGTNTYIGHVSAVAAGSFQISFTSIVGTASDSPVINFDIIKGVNA